MSQCVAVLFKEAKEGVRKPPSFVEVCKCAQMHKLERNPPPWPRPHRDQRLVHYTKDMKFAFVYGTRKLFADTLHQPRGCMGYSCAPGN